VVSYYSISLINSPRPIKVLYSLLIFSPFLLKFFNIYLY